MNVVLARNPYLLFDLPILLLLLFSRGCMTLFCGEGDLPKFVNLLIVFEIVSVLNIDFKSPFLSFELDLLLSIPFDEFNPLIS